MKSIAEAARKGGSDQVELEWDSYDKIKQEIAFEQLQWATEKAKGKEMAKVRTATAKAERISRIAQKRKKQEEKEKARELKRKMQEISKKDEKVADSQELKLKQRLTMRQVACEGLVLIELLLVVSAYNKSLVSVKSINSHVSIQGDTAHIPTLEKLNIELIKKENMQSEVSLAEQIKVAKSRRAESISTKVLDESINIGSVPIGYVYT
ncbi:uncharacterized protein LOC111276250 [Durio zibethinus]|uniref:Uncharacterized protein LOC111276250 n=1 Tax=Durio zibethinus TaxID=66656 RepID=A0A6P5WPF8_DURZI|nr:uncharacterized protein LOC111276250 [Durio zibethinus]